MGDENFSYFDDFPEYFYYANLRTALADLRLSKNGIEQIVTKFPLSDAKDRKALQGILIRMVADAQKPAKVIDIVWEHVLAKLRTVGFTEKAVHEIEVAGPITNPDDREILFLVLKKWLVANESRVPRGYPAHMKQLWKYNQLEKHKNAS